MPFRFSCVGLVLAVVLGASAPALASTPVAPAPCAPGAAHAGPMGIADVWKQLNLSPDQQARIQAIRDRNRRAHRPLHDQLAAARRSLRSYLARPDARLELALAQQRGVNVLEDRFARARLRTWFALRPVLRPDQLRRLAELERQAPPPRGRR